MKNNKGITVIALIVTIIILLILAGITISTLNGNNGILSNTETSKKTYEIGQYKDVLQVARESANKKKLSDETVNYYEEINNEIENKSNMKVVEKKDDYIIIESIDKKYRFKVTESVINLIWTEDIWFDLSENIIGAKEEYYIKYKINNGDWIKYNGGNILDLTSNGDNLTSNGDNLTSNGDTIYARTWDGKKLGDVEIDLYIDDKGGSKLSIYVNGNETAIATYSGKTGEKKSITLPAGNETYNVTLKYNENDTETKQATIEYGETEFGNFGEFGKLNGSISETKLPNTYIYIFGNSDDGINVSYEANGIELPTESDKVNGYTLKGWYLDEGLNETVELTSDGKYMPDKDVTLYAKWTAIEYNITYDLAGGSVGTANPTSYTVETADITLNNPTKTGYVFDGWTGSNGTTPQTTVKIAKGSTGNKTYTAKWTKAYYSIKSTYYVTLEDALAGAANSGSTINVISNVTDSSTVTNLKNVTLNLGSYTITRNTKIIENTGTLKITGTGSITTTTVDVINNSGTLTVGTVTLNSSSNRGMYNTGSVTISGGTITGSTAGIQNNSSGTITMSSGTVKGTGADAFGIQNGSSAKATITGGTVRGTKYGMYIDGTVTVGSLSNDLAKSPVISGGRRSLQLNSDATLNFYNGVLRGHTNNPPYTFNGTVNYRPNTEEYNFEDEEDSTTYYNVALQLDKTAPTGISSIKETRDQGRYVYIATDISTSPTKLYGWTRWWQLDIMEPGDSEQIDLLENLYAKSLKDGTDFKVTINVLNSTGTEVMENTKALYDGNITGTNSWTTTNGPHIIKVDLVDTYEIDCVKVYPQASGGIYGYAESIISKEDLNQYKQNSEGTYELKATWEYLGGNTKFLNDAEEYKELLAGNPLTTYMKTTDITVTFTDNSSGVVKIEGSSDGTNWTTLEQTTEGMSSLQKTVTVSGTGTYYFRATDYMGNTTSSENYLTVEY